jgi:galacturonosyltransferase
MNRVLILANAESAIYNFRRELLQRLVAENYEVTVAVPVADKSEVFRQIGCRVVNTKVSRHGTNPIVDALLLLNYIKLIKQHKPDVVLTYTVKPNVYGSLACRYCRIPYINNITGLGSALQKDNVLKKILQRMQKAAYKKSACVFFQNQSNLALFKKQGIVNGPTRLIPGSGVNLAMHKFEEYPPASEPVRFFIVSRIRQDKGFDEFFAAVKTVKARHQNVEFHIAGWLEDEGYRQTLDDMQQRNLISYHGVLSHEEVHTLIANCHCAVLPSYHEGMANVLLEAAAAGRPCLASDIPGCKEAIDNETSGCLFAVKDAGSLIQAIERFIELPYSEKVKMGIAGRNKMEKEFDRNIVINAYLEKIQEAIGEQNSCACIKPDVHCV